MHAKRYAVGSVTTAYVTAKLWYLSDDTVRWTGENTGGTILWYQAPPDTLWKCSETDAIGKCCAAIGIGAEVYLDTFDGEKSESGLEPGAECPKCGIPLEISPSPGHLIRYSKTPRSPRTIRWLHGCGRRKTPTRSPHESSV
jgi:hypothetical protein